MVTRARPIISAEAVAAVRRGLRMAFSRASTPAIPDSRRSGRPMQPGHRSGHERGQGRHPEEGDGDPDPDLEPPGGWQKSPSIMTATPRTRPIGSDDRAPDRSLSRLGHGGAEGGDGRDPGGPASRVERGQQADADPDDQRRSRPCGA